MATISRIGGLLNSQLIGQVAEPNRSLPENPPQRSVRELQAPPSPRGVDETALGEEFVHQQNDAQSPNRIQDVVQQLRETMNEYSAQPHAVGFREDPVTRDVIIEIRSPEGEVIKQFPAEKVLNLHRKLDELSGMVIDRMT